MSHSLIAADRLTHTKIVAVALAAATVLVLVGLIARHPSPHGARASAEVSSLVVRAGKPAVTAALATSTIR